MKPTDPTKCRVAFDTNSVGVFKVEGYFLHFEQSLQDMQRIEGDLHGKRVTIYMEDELEMDAILIFDEGLKVWVGLPIPGTVVML